MFSRIKTIVKLQLSDQIDLFAYQTRNRFIASIFIKIAIIGFLCVAMRMLFRLLVDITQIALGINELGTIIAVIQIVAIIACSIQLIHTLYISKENGILFTLPVKHNEIFISKLIVYYIYEFKRNLYLLIPMFTGYALAFGNYYGFGFSYWLRLLLLLFIIPLFPVLLGAIISLPLVFILNFIKKRTLLHIFVVLGSCLFISIMLAISFTNVGENLTPLEAWGTVIKMVKDFTTNFYQKTLFYQNLTEIIYNINFLKNSLIMLGIITSLILIIWFVSIPTYFLTAIYPFDDTNHKKYKKNMEPSTSTYKTFLSKELRMFFRSSDQVIGSFMYIIILPFLIFVLNDLYTHLKPSEFGENIILGINVLLGLVLLLASNVTSATAITREGSEFYLMKVVPTATYKIAWAKVTLNIAFSSAVIVVTTICLYATGILGIVNIIGIGLVFLFVNTAHILWSYELDLLKPRIHDYISGQSIDDNPNATKSILLGLLLAIIFAGLSIALIMEDFVTGWIRLLLIALVFLGARIYLFINRTNVYLEKIEI